MTVAEGEDLESKATTGIEAPEEPKDPPNTRAFNDPREVRRREREAKLKSQGVIK